MIFNLAVEGTYATVEHIAYLIAAAAARMACIYVPIVESASNRFEAGIAFAIFSFMLILVIVLIEGLRLFQRLDHFSFGASRPLRSECFLALAILGLDVEAMRSLPASRYMPLFLPSRRPYILLSGISTDIRSLEASAIAYLGAPSSSGGEVGGDIVKPCPYHGMFSAR